MGILSTQRSECTNNVCHGISKPTSSITDCFLGLEKVLKNWRRNEQDEDYKCSQSEIVPVIKNSSILKQAARFYSRRIYSIFEEEFIKAVGEMSIDFVSTDSSKYIVNYIEKKNQNHPWVVHFDATEGNIQCSCKKYETMGLLCSHCLRVFKQLDMAKFPEKYLLLRWSARARQVFYSGYLLNSKRSNNFQGGRGFIFRNQVSRFAYQMSTEAQGNEEAEEFILSSLQDMYKKLYLILGGKKRNEKDVAGSQGGTANLKDPLKRRPKGISNARLKSHWEKKKRPKSKLLITC
ncbi:Protein FAR1-RELATED SEQUENCE 9 [Dendrobium catenatum]|uniref:Protein FAR1-RELATED SEQUENCE n=1 Tax=Dendrobium catenatum TaxID=906689 RepID=A0A2I0VYH3_9ASPA|nr:Protein FAR1-RELATED SEQUENCE 9 [Dendrobium catenatum]